ncbi:uncharacterized protein DUF4243 [Stackebrandtia albiflava]|uniref:Uncharacterized protein DUF4243 n=1 Tax=Stackebrandtia albiflava TaxID=406432 RepID=A0A562VDJ9_9ACTN|nr:questin oxidase family protein [Stackebrandtia albiflava]TWJ15959.1 uncharacterized protein DUF4243 [Stackebrandtia albiflava]
MTGYLDAVHDALERLDDLGYERRLGGGDLANHGPMAAETIAVLGHGDHVPAWIDLYRSAAPHHEPPVPYQAIDPDDDTDWRAAMGDIGRAGDFEVLFTRHIDTHGWQDTLTTWWPRLLPGPMTGLTHGLIRTAHAVRSITATPTPSRAQLTELARGLGYWAARFIDHPGPGRLTGTLSIPHAVAALRRLDTPPQDPRHAARLLKDAHTLPGFREALERPAGGDPHRILSDMTAEFAGICVSHTDHRFPIPLVHGVTAPAAARLVLPWLPPRLHEATVAAAARLVLPWLPPRLHEATVAAVWQAQVTLLMLAGGDPAAETTAWRRARDHEPTPWPALAEAAVAHGDEHVVKFTEALMREHTLRPDPRYAYAARAAIDHIARPGHGHSAATARFGT